MIEIILDNHKVIRGLNDFQRDKIKEDLMIDNPTYHSAIKHSKWGGIPKNIPPYLVYFKENNNNLIVPIGYDIPFEFTTTKDLRKEVTINYPPIKIDLRKSQKEAYYYYLDDPSKGIISMPTGKGKSILGIYLAYALRQKALILVHKDDLVYGWQEDIKMCFDHQVNSGLIKAKSRVIGEQLTVATVQTLDRLSEEEVAGIKREFGMIIADECLVGDSLILKEDGGFMFIKDIQNKDLIHGGVVSNKFKRESPIYTLESRHSIIEGSPTHPTFVLPKGKVEPSKKNTFTFADLEVKCLKDIKAGDRVPIIKRIPHTTKYNWTPDQLSFVALIQADGHLDLGLSNRIKINVTNDKKYYLDLFTRGVKSFGDYEVKHSYDCRDNLTVWCNSKELKNILEFTFNIPRGKKSDKIIINEQIQYSPIESIESFIATIFSCESDLYLDSNSKYNKSARLNVNSTSKYFIQGLSYLLKKFGILCTYNYIIPKRTECNVLYRLSLGGHDLNTFMSIFSCKMLSRKCTSYGNIGKSLDYNIGDYVLVPIKNSYLTDREELVYDYTTTSHTFITNGMLTHNCHHVPSSTFGIINKFSAPYKIGLSATPERSDGLAQVMHYYLGDFAYICNVDKDDEDILPVQVIIKNSNIQYKPLCIQSEDSRGKMHYRLHDLVKDKDVDPNNLFCIDELSHKDRPKLPYFTIDDYVLRNPNYMEQVFKDVLKEFNAGRSIIMFFSQKEHCRLWRDYMLNLGIDEYYIQMYYGDMTEKKSDVLKTLEENRKRITLATYSIATEGTNVKQWEVAFLVSSLNNEKNVEQAVGRIRRRKEGKINPVLVYDYRHPLVYLLKNHGLNRDKRYKKLKFKLSNAANNKLFTRGYNVP